MWNKILCLICLYCLERESNEIVKEQNVANGIYLFTKDEVRSIPVGKFGNSVSSTARSVSKTFQERMNWNSFECRYTDIPISGDKNTIMYIYGWFGLWNDELGSVDKAKAACQSLAWYEYWIKQEMLK